jgi:alkanesulfonate monooxygenase SsuD/methylene tetrahydromethanopterin reductase-like flavin-dependent oxidoreductase (luciferase family)
MFIATLLGVTSQIKSGPRSSITTHHPVVVASNAAMLDNLFGGDSSWAAPAFSAPMPRHSDC